MKKVTVVTLALLMFAAAAMAASWTGWISDEKCGAKGASADHAACAKGCIKAGMKPVFATEDGKVLTFSNPDKVKSHAGEKVVLTGTEKDGMITVASVKPAQ